MEHAPLEHLGVAFGYVHFVPHVPQLFTSVEVEISQPFNALASQFPQPASQVPIEQTPVEHFGVACGKTQALPQPPQWLTLVLMSISHPVVALLSQFANPVLQDATEHIPDKHAGEPLTTEQIVPQAPQLFRSEETECSHPVLTLMSQSPKPALHEPIMHAPATHAAVPLTVEHVVAQAPQ